MPHFDHHHHVRPIPRFFRPYCSVRHGACKQCFVDYRDECRTCKNPCDRPLPLPPRPNPLAFLDAYLEWQHAERRDTPI